MGNTLSLQNLLNEAMFADAIQDILHIRCVPERCLDCHED